MFVTVGIEKVPIGSQSSRPWLLRHGPNDEQQLLRQSQLLTIPTSSLQIMSARTDVEATQNQLSSGVTPDSLKATLFDKLEASHVAIEDLSGIATIATMKL